MRLKSTSTRLQALDLCCVTVASPLGDLLLVADAEALRGVYFVGSAHVPSGNEHWTRQAEHPVLRAAQSQLREYFAGQRISFSLPLRPSGTPFQENVWRQIARIPYGQTVTYSELSKRAGATQAVRAVGTATGRNPISILIPCHRIVGKNGAMCGFAGGLDRKRHLLELETMKPNTAASRESSPVARPSAF